MTVRNIRKVIDTMKVLELFCGTKDIWTNHPAPGFKPPCKNGDPCHISAPRGATTGTQAMKNKIEKARIPKLLCEHIVDICEK